MSKYRNNEKHLDFSSVYFLYTRENLRKNIFHVLRCVIHSDTFNNNVYKNNYGLRATNQGELEMWRTIY